MNIRKVLDKMIASRASDLHLKAGTSPIVRVDGVLYTLDEPAPTAQQLRDVCNQLLNDEQRLYFSTHNEIDFAFGVSGLARFRANIFMQRSTPALALRHVPVEVPSIEELVLPSVVRELAFSPRGLILVTGRTGSGKSTTLASMIDAINSTTTRNIITIEDPIEFLHRDNLSFIHQRELGLDTRSFHDGLKYVLRQDPDIILVGEVRDLETMRTALMAADTGHLVLSTLHTIDAAGAIARLDDLGVDRYKVAASLKGVIAQRLLRHLCDGCRERDDDVPGPALGRWLPQGTPRWRERGCLACGRTGFRGRIAVVETMVMTPEIERAIASSAASDTIADAARAGGMVRLWESGIERVLAGTTSLSEVARVLDLPLPPATDALTRRARESLRPLAPLRLSASLDEFELIEP